MKPILASIVLCFSACLLWAKPRVEEKPLEFELQWKSSQTLQHWLFSKGTRYRGPSHLAPLALVKKYEMNEKFEECTEQILKIWPQYKKYQGWLALQGTQCLIYQMKFAGVRKPKIYSQWWKHLLKQKEWILFGLWSADLIRSWNEFSQMIYKASQLPLSFRSEVAESWRQYVDSLSRADRQDLYRVIVESLEADGKAQWANAIASREGLQKLGEVSANSTVANNLKKNGEVPARSANEEEDFYQRFLEAIKQNQLVRATELAVQALDQFPNGSRASQFQDRLLQTYFSNFESAQSTDQKKQLEQCIEAAKKIDASRLNEWARASHRRGDFRGAYALSKQALLSQEKSSDGAPLLFIAGRSAYFLGMYREAIGFFDQLTTRHYGYSEYWEARFRKALAFVRLGEERSAEEIFSELALAPDNKTYGQSSLYWLIRLKQKRKASVDDLLAVMQEKFAFTYYGLVLNAEASSQKITLPDETSEVAIRQNWVLTSEEKRQIQGAQELAQAGWYSAAQGEVNNLVFTGSPEHRFLWVQQLAQFFSFPQAIRMMNELVDLDPRWRKASYLKLVFPRPLEHVVRAEAQRNELNPMLVFSLIRQESAFYIGATSRSQAKGLMQLIPSTAQEVAQDLRIKNFDSDQMYHPIVNLQFGTYYLAKVIRQFGGNVSVGLAAYNAGPQRLKRFFEAREEVDEPKKLSQGDPWSDLWLEELPWLETNLYVKSILRNRVIYQLLEQGSYELPTPVWKDLFVGEKKMSQIDTVSIRKKK